MKFSEIFWGRDNTEDQDKSWKFQKDIPNITIYAEEVRQFSYCKRIIYWRRVANISGKPSYLMNLGTKYHLKRLRQTYTKKEDIATFRNKLFFHDELKLGGKLDICREQPRSIIAVEFKRFLHTQNPFPSHVLQALVGGIAASYELNKPLTGIEIQYYHGKKINIQPTIEMEVKLLDLIKEMRDIISLELLPKPTKNESKCSNCEFYKICQSV